MTTDELRDAGPLEAEMISVLQKACFSNPPDSGEIWTQTAIAEVLAMPGAFGIVAIRRALPCGFLLARTAAEEMEILSLGVMPSQRRRGVAGRLLRAAMERGAGVGTERVMLEVAEDNRAARNFYRTAGFDVVGRRPGYYRRRGARAAAALLLTRACG